MGITITGKRNATSKLLSAICSYTFEQEDGELKLFTKEEKEAIEKVKQILSKHSR